MSLIKLKFFTKNILVSISVSNLRSRNFPVLISILVSKKFYGLGLESCGLDCITDTYVLNSDLIKKSLQGPWSSLCKPWGSVGRTLTTSA